MMKTENKIVFASVENAGRSQMAAAWFNVIAHPEKARAFCGGTNPAAAIHPEVLNTMYEMGMDLRVVAPQKLTGEMLGDATHVITLSGAETCPVVPASAKRIDWSFDDPKGKTQGEIRKIRNDIRAQVAQFIQEKNWT